MDNVLNSDGCPEYDPDEHLTRLTETVTPIVYNQSLDNTIALVGDQKRFSFTVQVDEHKDAVGDYIYHSKQWSRLNK